MLNSAGLRRNSYFPTELGSTFYRNLYDTGLNWQLGVMVVLVSIDPDYVLVEN